MLIQKMLGMHKPEDYYFAVYKNNGAGIQSLLVKTKKGYYDVRNKTDIFSFQVKYKEHLTDYVTFDKEYISNRTAKEAAKPYFETFFKNTRKHDDEIFKDDSTGGLYLES